MTQAATQPQLQGKMRTKKEDSHCAALSRTCANYAILVGTSGHMSSLRYQTVSIGKASSKSEVKSALGTLNHRTIQTVSRYAVNDPWKFKVEENFEYERKSLF